MYIVLTVISFLIGQLFVNWFVKGKQINGYRFYLSISKDVKLVLDLDKQWYCETYHQGKEILLHFKVSLAPQFTNLCSCILEQQIPLTWAGRV